MTLIGCVIAAGIHFNLDFQCVSRSFVFKFVAEEGGAEQPAVHNHLPSELNEQCSMAVQWRRGQLLMCSLPSAHNS